MNVTAHRPNKPLCLSAVRLLSLPDSLFVIWRWSAHMGTFAEAPYMCCRFQPCARNTQTVQKCMHVYYETKNTVCDTHRLMRHSISCCMRLKMASGRRSIVHLLRGHAAAFLYHLKEKKILQCSSSSVK